MKYRLVVLLCALVVALVYLCLGGCELMPDSIPVEAQHLSHVGQHFHPDGQPMYGAETILTGLRWRRGGVQVDVLDGWTTGIDGRHEVFSARVSTEISLK